MSQQEPVAHHQVLRLAQIKARTGLSRSTIYALMKSNTFPKSINLGPRSVGWIEGDINRWLDSRIEASKNAG